MTRSRIYYAMFFFPVLVCNILLGGYIFLLALLLLIVFPILSYLAMCIHASQMELYLYQKANHCLLGIKTCSFFPLAIINTEVILENSFTREIQKQGLWLFTSGGKEIDLTSFYTFQQGNCNMRIESFTYYDMLGLFKKQISWRKQVEFMIYPNFVDTGIVLEQKLAEYAMDGYGNAMYRGNLEDKHEVREYIPGDKLNRIHHKLSYKLSKIMVREFAAIQQESVSIFVDFSCDLQQCGYVFSCLKDVLMTMMKQKQSVLLYWQSDEQIHDFKIESEEDIWNVIKEILMFPKAQEFHFPVSDACMWILTKDGIMSTKGGETIYAAKKS